MEHDEPGAGTPERAIACVYCGARIVADPAVRTPTSAWSAPDAEDPTQCVPSAPGHSPDTTPHWTMKRGH